MEVSIGIDRHRAIQQYDKCLTNKVEVMVRKRAAGGGRKPKGDFHKVSSSFSIRMPAEMRAELKAAAGKNDRAEGQELLRRLQDSFHRDRDKSRDPASRALCYLLAELIELVSLNSFENPKKSEWRNNPFAFRVIKLAFTQILKSLEPKGEIQPPSGEWLNAFFMIRTDKPDEMAEVAAVIILSMLHTPLPSNPTKSSPGIAQITYTRRDRQRQYGMSDALRDFHITKGKKS
jgi:hypothetical protein